MNILHFIANLTDSAFILQYGGLGFLTFIVFAECSFLVGFFLPGNALIFISGIACYSTPQLLNVNIFVLILALSFGAMFGNFIGYQFGKRKFGPFLFKNKNSRIFKQHYLTITGEYYTKNGGKTLIVGRFLPLIRTFAPIIAGIVHMDFKKFMLFNVIGAIIWTGVLAGIGYYLGSYPWVEHNINYIITIMVLLTVIPMIIRGRRKKNREKALATQQQ
jgi:membrane-associated protein